MIDFIIKYWVQALFGLLITLFSYMNKCVKKFKNHIDCNKMGITLLLKRELMEYYEQLIKKENITLEEKDNFNEIVKTYKCFDESRVVDDLEEKLNNMPSKLERG